MALFTVAQLAVGAFSAISTFVGSLGAPGNMLIKSHKEEEKNDRR